MGQGSLATQGNGLTLNLITDKGYIYSFTLQDVSGTAAAPDLKVMIEPADHSAIVASQRPSQYVPAAQLDQTRQQLAALQSHVTQAVDEYKSAYRSASYPLPSTLNPDINQRFFKTSQAGHPCLSRASRQKYAIRSSATETRK